jgi:hypothetical protein
MTNSSGFKRERDRDDTNYEIPMTTPLKPYGGDE